MTGISSAHAPAFSRGELVTYGSLMGWPPGHVTNVPGVTDPQALRICGNGVVPQQAAAAARALLHDLATESAA